MQRVERTAVVEAPADELFAYLADLDRLAEWQTGVVSVRRTSPGPIAVGATAHLVRDLAGQRVEAPLAVAVYEPPRRLVIDTEASGIRASAGFTLDGVAGAESSTSLTFAMEVRGSFMTRFLEGVIASAATSEIETSLARLRARFATSRDA
jgi:carbon monoxide dehydrogenase subunit G